ncbi:Kinesin-like protein KIF13A [Zootermopsis nevadensis]|uniref:Kinesin-like protein KIF13A n=1 Tax=Zootermopsis nevadensis TaxID=136037 RepID=A0A067QQU0_ZOONE|nr:Kinesin-like protein KIF13A [Zootermopsis nevadensis]
MASEPQTPAQTIDYNFAREELMLNELSNDPIQTAIARLEKQHEEDKQVALEKQRQEYERQFQQLRNILSPSTPYSPYVPFDPFRLGKITPCTPTTQMRVEKWAQERDEMFKRSLGQLKADILRANALVQEANFLAEEMGRQTTFSVTLQIPPANLSPNRKRGAFVSEPAILVKRKGLASQVWSMEKLENKLIDMRDLYEEKEEKNVPLTDEAPQKSVDPFYESQENHNLIGVANIFLEVLFHDVRLDYHTPIISQQGEVAGRLQVELSRVAGSFPQDRMCEAGSDSSGDSGREDDELAQGSSQVVIRVTIKQATGLPLSLSNFVFCQYSFWNHPDSIAVPPVVNPEYPVTCSSGRDSMTFKFDHSHDFDVPVTEEFLEHCSEGALSIEVWGHRCAGFTRLNEGWEVEQQQLAKARSLADRWSELTRKIQLWVEIQELNEQGEYSAVEVTTKPDILTGGIYQLRQGQQRRIQVRVKPVQNSGTLPIICQSIVSIAVGSVSMRSRLQKPLDSYQEEDLAVLREKWSDALMRRRQYLDQQIQRLINKQDKSEQDLEREQSLVDQWVSLTEERNAVLVPSAGSGIPGAPADWDPPSGMEPHVPVLFLDLNADDLSTHQSGEEVSVTGLNSILPKEHGNKFYNLPIIRHLEKDVCAVAAWDSSIHDSIYLNRVTEANERVYLILKTTVHLSHPATMDLVLRKRLSLNIYKRQSIADRIRRKIVKSDCLNQCGVTYEVVSNIPKASEELEDRESLAQIAASGVDSSLSDGETYIEKYTRGVSAVESILTLDRLRQNVAVKELLQAQGQPLMRKTASVPNFSQIMRFDSSLDIGVVRSESATDLNSELMSGSGSRESRSRPSTAPGYCKVPGDGDHISPSPKPFGLASPNIAVSKLGLRMTTLHEEQSSSSSHSGLEMSPLMQEKEPCNNGEDHPSGIVGNVKSNGTNNISSGLNKHCKYDNTGFQGECSQSKQNQLVKTMLPSSRTLDSLCELQATKMGTPSTTSSGYGSQAVSSTNLSSEDSISIRSISVDETPDIETVKNETRLKCVAQETATQKSIEMMEKERNLDITGQPLLMQNTTLQEEKQDSALSVLDKNSLSLELTNSHTGNLENINDSSLNDSIGIVEYSSVPQSMNDNCNEAEQTVEDALQHASAGQNCGISMTESPVSDSQSEASRIAAYDSTVMSPFQETQILAETEPTSMYSKVISSPGLASTSVINSDEGDSNNLFGSRRDLHRLADTPVPDWVVLGESVLIRPYNSSGVVAYIGDTYFSGGTWVGVELDAPTGKNDGSVQSVRYFTCRPKCGIFVRADKLIQDRRGRAMRVGNSRQSEGGTMKRSSSRGD